MRLEIHFRDMEATDGIKTHIEEKAEKLRRFTQDNELVRVFVRLDGDLHEAEVVFHDHQRGKDLVAKERGSNLYTQIDATFEVLATLLHKEHDKMVAKHKREPLKKLGQSS